MAHENATPRPWRFELDRLGVTVRDGTAKPVCEIWENGDSRSANAALIVEAVNAYDTLRAENERLKAAVAGVIKWDKRRGYIVPYAVRDPLHAALSEAKP